MENVVGHFSSGHLIILSRCTPLKWDLELITPPTPTQVRSAPDGGTYHPWPRVKRQLQPLDLGVPSALQTGSSQVSSSHWEVCLVLV